MEQNRFFCRHSGYLAQMSLIAATLGFYAHCLDKLAGIDEDIQVSGVRQQSSTAMASSLVDAGDGGAGTVLYRSARRALLAGVVLFGNELSDTRFIPNGLNHDDLITVDKHIFRLMEFFSSTDQYI